MKAIAFSGHRVHDAWADRFVRALVPSLRMGRWFHDQPDFAVGLPAPGGHPVYRSAGLHHRP